jgi:hypothetical protein
MLLGIRFLWRANRMGLTPYLLLICAFPITYYLTHPTMDYRQPIEPAVVVLLTAGAMSLFLRSDKRKGLAGFAGDCALADTGSGLPSGANIEMDGTTTESSAR